MPLWVVITLIATLIQSVRVSLQKHLTASLSKNAVNWTRYGFGMPLVFAYVYGLTLYGSPLPTIPTAFWGYVSFACLGQIIATWLMLSVFSYRAFAVGVTYVKTQALQAAIIGALFFSEHINRAGWTAICLSSLGILLISLPRRQTDTAVPRSWKPVAIGLGAGFVFALSTLCIRESILTLQDAGHVMRSAYTLLVMVTLQTIGLGAYISWKERQSWALLRQKWKSCLLVGLTGVGASVGWFTALSLTNASYMKTVAQAELLIAMFVTQRIFREKLTAREITGILLMLSGIIGLALGKG